MDLTDSKKSHLLDQAVEIVKANCSGKAISEVALVAELDAVYKKLLELSKEA